MAIAPGNYFKVVYNGKNITNDISSFVTSISYVDKVNGESDELEIRLDDTDLNWQNSWYPMKGDKITAELGTDNGRLVKCGTFTIDSISLSGPPDEVSIKALSSGISAQLRTKKSYAHENKTLREIVNTIASKNGYTISGNIDNIRVGRSTQYRESDLQFLQRLANDFGYAFSIKDKILVFESVFELEAFPQKLVLDKTDITSYSFQDKTFDTYSAVEVKYYGKKDNKVVSSRLPSDVKDAIPVANTEVLVVRGKKAENEAQANAISKSHLHKKNSMQQTASFEFPGNSLALSGSNILISGFGLLTGVYHILTATHTIDRDSGYVVSVETKRVQAAQAGTKTKPLASKNTSTKYTTK